jgi:ATP-dependent Clp protease ATP-binding subunit ClpA
MRRRGRRLADVRTIRTLLTAAEAEAQARGEVEPSAEHLVMAALGLPDGSARRALRRLGADPDDFRAAVDAHHDAALRSVGIETDEAALDDHLSPPTRPRGPYHSSGSAQQLFQQVAERVKTERSHLCGAWVLFEAAELRRGTTAEALRRMGLEPEAVQRAAREEAISEGSG